MYSGLGCAGDSCKCGGKCKGVGNLLDVSTWGPADYLMAAGALFVTWRVFAHEKKQRYSRVIRRRLGAE